MNKFRNCLSIIRQAAHDLTEEIIGFGFYIGRNNWPDPRWDMWIDGDMGTRHILLGRYYFLYDRPWSPECHSWEKKLQEREREQEERGRKLEERLAT